MNPPVQKSKLASWIQAVRPFALTASLIPVLLAAALAGLYSSQTDWHLLPVVLFAALAFQAATNMVSDYYDYKKGVDRPETFGSSRVLVDKLLTPKAVLTAGLTTFAAGIIAGLILTILQGWPLLIIGAAGLLAGLFYSATPVGYKYHALGDLAVFIMMGPLMVFGAFFALTGQLDARGVIVSFPIGFLVTSILAANNLRDIKHDTQANVKSFASVLGATDAKVEYCVLVIGAYVTIGMIVAAGLLSDWSLLVFLTIPLAVRNIKYILKGNSDNPATLATGDIKSAQLHLLFGLTLTAAIILENIFK